MTANLVNSLKKRKRRDEENDDNDSDGDRDDDDDDDDADNNNNGSNVDKYKERGKIIASMFFVPEKNLNK